MPSRFQLNDIGTRLRCLFVEPDNSDADGEATLPFDISNAATKVITLEKPDGSLISRAGTFETDGTDGVLLYSTVSGDINQDGHWYAQGVVTFSNGDTFHSDRVRFRVWSNNA